MLYTMEQCYVGYILSSEIDNKHKKIEREREEMEEETRMNYI